MSCALNNTNAQSFPIPLPKNHILCAGLEVQNYIAAPVRSCHAQRIKGLQAWWQIEREQAKSSSFSFQCQNRKKTSVVRDSEHFRFTTCASKNVQLPACICVMCTACTTSRFALALTQSTVHSFREQIRAHALPPAYIERSCVE